MLQWILVWELKAEILHLSLAEWPKRAQNTKRGDCLLVFIPHGEQLLRKHLNLKKMLGVCSADLYFQYRVLCFSFHLKFLPCWEAEFYPEIFFSHGQNAFNWLSLKSTHLSRANQTAEQNTRQYTNPIWFFCLFDFQYFHGSKVRNKLRKF